MKNIKQTYVSFALALSLCIVMISCMAMPVPAAASGAHDDGIVIELDEGVPSGMIVGYDGYLYVQIDNFDDTPTIVCLDTNGNIIWREEIINLDISNRIVVSDDKVVATTTNGYVYALDANSGGQVWRFNLGTPVKYTSPAIYDGTMIVATEDKLYSITDGKGDWASDLESIPSDPIIHEDMIYIGDASGSISIYDMDGDLQISRSVSSTSITHLIADSDYIIATSESNIVAMQLDGSNIWQVVIDRPSAPAASSAGYAVATPNHIIMIDRHGNELWRYDLGETLGGGAPIIHHDIVYAVSNEHTSRLIALDLDGSLIEEIDLLPAQYTVSTPIIMDDNVIVSSQSGHVYLFDAERFETKGGVVDPTDPDPVDPDPTDPGNEDATAGGIVEQYGTLIIGIAGGLAIAAFALYRYPVALIVGIALLVIAALLHLGVI